MNIIINIFLIWNIFFLIFLVHDLAQFLTAKILRTGVDSFVLGYGRTIWQLPNKEGHTIYAIKAIPLKTVLTLTPPCFELDQKKNFTYRVKRFFQWLPIYPAGPIAVALAAGGILLYDDISFSTNLIIPNHSIIDSSINALSLFVKFIFNTTLFILSVPLLSAMGAENANWIPNTIQNINGANINGYINNIAYIGLWISAINYLPFPIFDAGKTIKIAVENCLNITLERGVTWAISFSFLFFIPFLLLLFFIALVFIFNIKF